MSHLNQVIKRVSEKKELNTTQSFFIINEKNGDIETRWFPKLIGKNVRYYIISNARLARNSAEAQTRVVPVKDFQNRREIGIIIHYHVQCPEGNEKKLVLSLCGEATPEEALLNIIENIVLNYVNSKEAEFIDGYMTEKDKLNSLIRKEVESETGLDTRIQISLKFQENLDIFKITEKSIPIQLKEGIDEHSVRFSLDSEPDPARVVNAVMAYPDLHLLEKKLVRAIQTFFKTQVPYQVFHDGFRNEELTAAFADTVNKILYKEGRLPAKWKMDTFIKGGRANEFETLSVEIQRTPYQASAAITVKNELQMILQDAAKLKSSGVTDFKRWIEESLERIIEEEVFEKKYLDFLLAFGPVEEKIRERMKKKSELIGYKVKHLISRPDMEEEKYLKPTTYEFNYNDLPTREADLDINLRVAVSFSISDLNKVKTWLNKNINLESVIELSIRSELEQILHSASPETVYMKFSIMEQGNSDSLENRLSNAVTKHLTQKYHADVIGVPVIKPVETEISSFARNIIDATQDFSVTLKPFGQRQYESTFHGKFTITSINERGWNRIKKMDFTIDEVKNFFIDSLNAHLGSLPGDQYLLYNNPELRRNLERVANEVANKAVVDRYGVDIVIDNFKREAVAHEEQKIAAIEKRERLKIKTIEHILEDKLGSLKHDGIIAETDRAASQKQAEIIHERKEKYLREMDPLADGEDLEQLKQLDKLEKERFKRNEMNSEEADLLLAELNEAANPVSGLPSPDPFLMLTDSREISSEKQTEIPESGE